MSRSSKKNSRPSKKRKRESSAQRHLRRARQYGKDPEAKKRAEEVARKARWRRAKKRKETKVISCSQSSIWNGPLVLPTGYTRSRYLEDLKKSNTCKLGGGRWHVENALYEERILEKDWNIMDVREMDIPFLELDVKTADDDISCHKNTTITVCDTLKVDGGGTDLCNPILEAARTLKATDINARRLKGALKGGSRRKRKYTYRGGMVGVGRRNGATKYRKKGKGIHQKELFAIHDEASPKYNERFNAALPKACTAMADFVKKWYPAVFHEMQKQEKELGVKRSDVMGSKSGLSSTADFSIDLNNSDHWDCYDGTSGCSLWLTDKETDCNNWFFLLPFTHVDGDKRPIAIKLGHGIYINWDGRRGAARHCSSKPNIGSVGEVAGKRVYGCFWCTTIK